MSAAPSITGASARLPDIAKSGQLMCSKTGHFYLLLTDEIYRQKLYLQALEHHCNNLTIIKGHFFSKGEICRNCNHYNSTFEEKKTDVNIACEMLADAYENRFDVSFLVSGDSDLVPAVEKVITIGKRLLLLTRQTEKVPNLIR